MRQRHWPASRAALIGIAVATAMAGATTAWAAAGPAPGGGAPTAPVTPPYSPKHATAPAPDQGTLAAAGRAGWAAGTRAYFVLSAPGDVAAAKKAVTDNGGTVFASYDSIGVQVAHSAGTGFAAAVRGVAGVQKVGATRTSDVPAAAYDPAVPASPSQQATTKEEKVLWDMSMIGADKAWASYQGSADVTVGVLDTGVDDQHQDLKPNFDAARSVSCAYGRADTRAGAWRPVDRHGTHVAGTIAAAKNGKGVVGVAPGVKVASVRVAEPEVGNLFFPENTVCAFLWAADKGIKVTNNSYYTDPWLFNCPNDPDQDAILEASKRAVAYAEGKGVVNIAAAGNESYNLADKKSDSKSPDDSKAVTRTVTNDCLQIPGELPGVVSVSSLGEQRNKASYSNYGTGKIQVTAPGGTYGVTSTLPGGTYGDLTGTSMASPHVAGVAALLVSKNPGLSPADVRTRLAQQATDLGCQQSDFGCTGTAAVNNFYGEGIVDALKAVGGASPSPSPSPTGSPSPSPSPTVGPTVSPTSGPTTSPGSCTVTAWTATKFYWSGDQVSHNGRKWTASQPSYNRAPGTTDPWGGSPWQDNGAC
ncbi:S8 family peptidase [Longispora urticae]